MISVQVKAKTYKDKYLQSLQRQQVELVTVGGQVIRSEQVVRAPKDTGNLRNSHVSESFIENGIPVSETGPTADYAEYVENGTSRQKAQPFAEPGFQAFLAKKDAIALRILRQA